MLSIIKFSKNITSHKMRMILVMAVLVGLVSCKREILKPELNSNLEGNTYGEVFQSFWKGINSNYLFWDAETVNWDSMYRVYKPKFDSLDQRRYSDTTTNICFQYMADMTKNLRDGQYALMVWQGGNYYFEDSFYKSYISFIPKLQRTQRNHDPLPDTLFDYIIQNNYLKEFD